jgi:TatD DNase family protein
VLTDTHCHLDARQFRADQAAVIARALKAGVMRMLAPGVSLESSAECARTAAANAAVFAAVGIHPSDGGALQPDWQQQLRELAAQRKVVAIGEIGLDYYWVHEPAQQAQQRELLQAQLRLASELGKPVILHCRERGDASRGPCIEDLLAILSDWMREMPPSVSHPGVLHSFSSNLQAAQRATELGFLIGVTGPVTYKTANVRREVIAALPLDRLLIETDSPYLAPEPHRGQRNEPAFVVHIADKIAAVQSRTTEEVESVTAENASRLFSWGESV